MTIYLPPKMEFQFVFTANEGSRERFPEINCVAFMWNPYIQGCARPGICLIERFILNGR